MTEVLMPDEMFTVREITVLGKLSERCVRKMIAEGRLPVIRLTDVRAVRVPANAVDTLLNGNGAKAVSAPARSVTRAS
jgi:excisionase family DNA binding protein